MNTEKHMTIEIIIYRKYYTYILNIVDVGYKNV